METVSSLRISGEVEGDDATRDLDLALDDDGNYEGTFAIDGVPADILIVDARLFVRGGERFWIETGLAAGLPSGSGVIADGLPGEPEPEDDLGGICDLQSLLAEFTEADWDAVSTGEATEIDGTPALEFIAEDDRGTTRMWVSTGQDNHVLKLAREGPEPDEYTLGDYNEPVDVSVLDENEILDLTPTGS